MNKHRRVTALCLILLIAGLIVLSSVILAAPQGPRNIKNLSASQQTTMGAKAAPNNPRGTITTMTINVSQQTSSWKAYVGNITGKITLDDADNYTIYSWPVGAAKGEVYATRKSTTVAWASLKCANISVTETEQTSLSHSQAAGDAINRTFTNITHPAFYAGAVAFPAKSCNKSADLYRNDTANPSTWHEVLLYDSTNIVYASIINDTAKSYNTKHRFDFQMIVAENASSVANPAAITYYFYVELS